MQRLFLSFRAPRPALLRPLLLALIAFLPGCMSLRHKVDPVSITLNVKLENVDPEDQPPSGPHPTASLGSAPR